MIQIINNIHCCLWVKFLAFATIISRNHIEGFSTFAPTQLAFTSSYGSVNPTSLYASVSSPKTNSDSKMRKLPPTEEDEPMLYQSWFQYLKDNSEDFDRDCGHIYGFDLETSGDFTLSMLQRITAQRIVDYAKEEERTSEKTDDSDNSKSEKDLVDQYDTFKSENGPILSLFEKIQNESPKMALAAEFKKASPSKGEINPNLKAGEQATSYFEAGASVISVLTEERWFQGNLRDLRDARLQTQNSPREGRPVILRKDFVVSKYQILEAAAYGADTILLIVAVTPAPLLKELIDYAREFGMEPLVEVHADAELQVALDCGAKVIGVNNRNLHTFQMDLATTDKTAAILGDKGLAFNHGDEKQTYALCALSGMSTSEDVQRYRNLGVGMVLIGESLMRASDPGKAIQNLCLDPADYEKSLSTSNSGGAYIGGTKIVKVCGITSPEDALLACKSGANLIGVIFAEKSKRKVSSDDAKKIVEAVQSFGERDVPCDFSSYIEKVEGSPISALSQKSRILTQLATSRRPLVVGVFQNQSPEFIAEVVQNAGLDLVQLHGKEGFEACDPSKTGGVPAIRVMDIPASDNNEEDKEKSRETMLEEIMGSLTNDPLAILFDTTIRGSSAGGGTGQTFDWEIASKIQSEGLPILIAGGLTPSNIGEAVAGVRPFGVDVSSGTEQSPGKKDADKVRDFVKFARVANDEASKGF